MNERVLAPIERPPNQIWVEGTIHATKTGGQSESLTGIKSGKSPVHASVVFASGASIHYDEEKKKQVLEKSRQQAEGGSSGSASYNEMPLFDEVDTKLLGTHHLRIVAAGRGSSR